MKKKTKDRIIVFLLMSVLGLIVAIGINSYRASYLEILLFNFLFGLVFLMGLYSRTSKYSIGLVAWLGMLFGAVLVIIFKILF